MTAKIATDPKAFQESFFEEISNTQINGEYDGIFRVILFYIWRGCSISQESGISGKCDPYTSLLALSSYESVLGILQLIRIGYHADALILLRVLMEKIAIVGYLGENRHDISRYVKNNNLLYKPALKWAKEKSLPNWMILYNQLSSIVHSNKVGFAAHINNHTDIGKAFRLATEKYPTAVDVEEELLGLTVYSLLALDTLTLLFIQNTQTNPFSSDQDMINNVGIKDFKAFSDFLHKLVDQYKDT